MQEIPPGVFAVSKRRNAPLFFVVTGLRFLLLTLWFFVAVFIGCVICIFKFRNPDVPRIVCSIYSPVSAWLAGIKTVQRDWHNTVVRDNSAVYVANHQSFLDLSFFGHSLPVNTVCVAKTTLKWVPLFGIFWYASGNVYVDRQRRDSAVQSLDAAAQRLRDGECSLWIFPEGTRNHKDRNHLLPFKKGAFHVAVQSGRPIVPVVASNQSWIYDPGHGHWRGGVILMRALPPIETKNKTIADVDDLIAQTYAAMQKALEEVNAEAKQLNGA